ncbi:unnamed protein product [Citrullus colocynthis]|uniref:RNase H type-1 domain-containing protein n=1 Tax=Citrullus colocynthis TaxID=252529 RepID=A0ABP0XVM0_9ROSI
MRLGVRSLGWVVSVGLSSSWIGGGCLPIGKYWKIKVLEMKAIKEGLKAFRSRFRIFIPSLLVESDFVEAITSLYEIDSDLLDIKSIACSILKLAEDFGNIHFAKCSRWFTVVIGETSCLLGLVA